MFMAPSLTYGLEERVRVEIRNAAGTQSQQLFVQFSLYGIAKSVPGRMKPFCHELTLAISRG